MKENNGKIAIAILAMFVVALSVVGFTYAYFTASVKPNNAATSVTVNAGILQVDYQYGTKLAASNLVPGWISDGHHFYDPVASADTTKTPAQITAVTTDNEKKTIETPGAADGITAPVTFTIKNTGTATSAYKILLTVDENTITDPENMVVYLVKGTWTDKILTETTAAALGTEMEVEAKGQVMELDVHEQLNAGAEQDYYVVMVYKNLAGSQNASMGKVVQATVSVDGLSQEATTTVTAG